MDDSSPIIAISGSIEIQDADKNPKVVKAGRIDFNMLVITATGSL